MAITQNIFHSVYKMKDMDDNILTLHAHREGLYKITIQLRSEKREREIAQIDVEHRCMSMTRDKSKHFMRALCGYGFNWTLINKDMPMRVDNVLLIEHDGNDTDYYLIPINEVKRLGEKKYFGKVGMELQWFMHMREIVKFRLKDLSSIKGFLVCS